MLNMNSISDDKKIWRKLKFRTGRQTPASPLRLGISHFQVDYRGIIVKAIQPLSLLKIYCTDFSSTPYLIHLTLCPLHPMLRVNVMLDFICMGFVAPRGTRSKRKLKNEKHTHTVGFELTTFRSADRRANSLIYTGSC